MEGRKYLRYLMLNIVGQYFLLLGICTVQSEAEKNELEHFIISKRRKLK